MTKPNEPKDTNQKAKFIVDLATEETKEPNKDTGKNLAAVAQAS